MKERGVPPAHPPRTTTHAAARVIVLSIHTLLLVCRRLAAGLAALADLAALVALVRLFTVNWMVLGGFSSVRLALLTPRQSGLDLALGHMHHALERLHVLVKK